MGDLDSTGPSADSALTFDDDPADFDPASWGDADSDRLAVAWPRSDALRKMLTDRNPPDDDDRRALKAWLIAQLPTLFLYWKMGLFRAAVKAPSKTISLYILLFPGEARDNTGIKDLNDNVIGQWWNAQYQQKRYEAIADIFVAQDGFEVAAQTYKTAFIITFEKSRKDFIKKLAVLDELLLIELLDILKLAAVDNATTDKQKAEIKKLSKKLSKEGYRFDVFFGLRTLEPPQGGTTLANVYLLVTEAMKGAALARFAAKGQTIPSRAIQKVAAQAGVDLDPKKDDPRGKAYDWSVYIRASNLAEKIKGMVLKGTVPGVTVEMNSIYVNTVWTFAFMEYKNVHWGNPDVIRDVRKKKLRKAPGAEGNVTYSFPLQQDIMELWLVVLNMLDFVKSFESAEFDNKLKAYHDKALKGFLELALPDAKIDWNNLQYVLTHDVRQADPIAVIGTACEFQFYAKVSDFEQRIFFSMDIRDMGVELMLAYEHSNREVGYHRYSDQDLMEETLRSTDPIDVRRRLTYDIVVATFKKHYDQLAKNPAAALQAAQDAFGGAADSKLGTFADSVQFMLGGDEVYVATHPLFAGVAPAIVGDLDQAVFEPDRPVDLRTSVAFSRAPKTDPAQQREAIQKSHQQALKRAELAPGTLKALERTNRRIERLIDMIEANPKKQARAPGYRQELAKLPLRALFARWKSNWTKTLNTKERAKIYAALQTGDAATVDEYVELVDFSGKVVDRAKLEQDAKTLEDKVRQDVGRDNVQIHAPPIVAIPKWIQHLIDKLKDKDPGKKKP